MDRALLAINEEHFTITERILKKYQHNKEEALQKIAYTIETIENLPKHFFIYFRGLEQLNPAQKCVVAITGWLDFEAGENLYYAIGHHFSIVIEQIDKHLMIPEMATILNAAAEINQEQDKEQERLFQERKARSSTPEFKFYENRFYALRPKLIEVLHKFVVDNINLFP
ncbi:hypothetical protein [Taibaiella soli]|uniref:DUF4375 domain-containing protein n=1 Tax=Taibaiella soli TaxID=1649169 RepID=A0A2W2AAI6_9BACT|nr:hypothetical protein [Taibaiella soli]PZF72291.1 hypothetical protein DN068_13095 [Taibaiella soli]